MRRKDLSLERVYSVSVAAGSEAGNLSCEGSTMCFEIVFCCLSISKLLAARSLMVVPTASAAGFSCQQVQAP